MDFGCLSDLKPWQSSERSSLYAFIGTSSLLQRTQPSLHYKKLVIFGIFAQINIYPLYFNMLVPHQVA